MTYHDDTRILCWYTEDVTKTVRWLGGENNEGLVALVRRPSSIPVPVMPVPHQRHTQALKNLNYLRHTHTHTDTDTHTHIHTYNTFNTFNTYNTYNTYTHIVTDTPYIHTVIYWVQ
jgi:hypothetical protein